MDFEKYVSSIGGDSTYATHEELALWGMGYAKKIDLPNVCSLSSLIFTHGSPSYDPGVDFNRRFYSAPIDIAHIAPYIARNNNQEHKQYWFNKENKNDVLRILDHAAVSWLLFSVNPYKYEGVNGHMVGVRNEGNNFEVWDTTQRKPFKQVNDDGLWQTCLSHMYGQNPIMLTFK